MATLSKVPYRVNVISLKIPTVVFVEVEKPILKFLWNCKGPWIGKTVLKKSKVGRLTLLDFKAYNKGTVIKTVWHWHKNKHIDQWNRTEIPEINPHIYGQLIFNKGAKTIWWRKKQSLQQTVLEQPDIHTQGKKSDPSLIPNIKINWKCIRNLSIRAKTILFIEENRCKPPQLIFGSGFLDMTRESTSDKRKSR